MIIRKVIGVPDSFVVEVDGHRYQRNKHDLTLTPPRDNNDDGDNHSDVQSTPIAAAVMPTLWLRPQIKFPKLPVQATQQKDFKL